ncbi:MAG: hypothetical protein K2Y22_03960 [Candidatus Obscuribacterales bacterium]|nr:hypothetical protein [Candidatus Obscuribacterales bacterium]
MQTITPDLIATVKDNVKMLDVISEHVTLQPAGNHFTGLCPFRTHSAKTQPSFQVDAERGIFKCIECGEGGDVFAFVMKTKSVNFLDAVRYLIHQHNCITKFIT